MLACAVMYNITAVVRRQLLKECVLPKPPPWIGGHSYVLHFRLCTVPAVLAVAFLSCQYCCTSLCADLVSSLARLDHDTAL